MQSSEGGDSGSQNPNSDILKLNPGVYGIDVDTGEISVIFSGGEDIIIHHVYTDAESGGKVETTGGHYTYPAGTVLYMNEHYTNNQTYKSKGENVESHCLLSSINYWENIPDHYNAATHYHLTFNDLQWFYKLRTQTNGPITLGIYLSWDQGMAEPLAGGYKAWEN